MATSSSASSSASSSEEESAPPPQKKLKPYSTPEDGTKERALVIGLCAQSAQNSKKKEMTQKSPFQRLWGDGDEIALLKNFLTFADQEGKDPAANISEFYGFVKESISFDVSRDQVKNKLRQLKEKFLNFSKKQGKNKKKRAFTNANEEMVFDFSKKIWGHLEREEDDGVEVPRKKMAKVSQERSKYFERQVALLERQIQLIDMKISIARDTRDALLARLNVN
ncbi:GLABROUS1 enhancer-binding protein family [Dillenia turbinata]|uniref:GLABROUS1 enhancer-binding protein family n=1 Tax=Dillenia turbinata TaxID=194707 RepID=A0AAN8Z5V3_9MAGN